MEGAMVQLLARKSSLAAVTVLAAGCFLGCDYKGGYPPPGDVGSGGMPPESETTTTVWCNEAPVCDSALTVAPDGPAMVVTDPVVLAHFPLDKVIQQILDIQGVSWTPSETMQRFFDSMNDEQSGKFSDVVHCDSPQNAATQFGLTAPMICPRAEGQLAFSETLMADGDPDSFFPVAIVNRFDLTPLDASRCGQYRIVYAKTSGLTDPNNRVFLIFEAALQSPMPGCLDSCLPVAKLWKGLEGKSSAEIASDLDTFFFSGIGSFGPVVHPVSYGLDSIDQGYGAAEGGQIRVSMHMEDPWDMREVQVGRSFENGEIQFQPVTVKNNPVAAYFDPVDVSGGGLGTYFRQNFVQTDLVSLASPDLIGVQMFTRPEYNGAESALGGATKNDYSLAALKGEDPVFIDSIGLVIADLGLSYDCPTDDPFDAAAAFRRANMLSCAGCHAPKEFLGEDRSIGCGLTWPDSIGQSHITETSELSPALKEVFLPHRAEVLQIYLQGCDMSAFTDNLQSAPGGRFKKHIAGSGVSGVGTLGGSVSH